MANQAKAIGTVILIEGVVFARNADGEQRELKVGDTVFEGEIIVTAEAGRVEFAFDQGGFFLLRSNETVTLDSTVFDNILPDRNSGALLTRVSELTSITNAINEGGSLDRLLQETSSGGNGGADAGGSAISPDDGNSFVRLLRATEALATPAYDYNSFDQQSSVYVPAVLDRLANTVPPTGSNSGVLAGSGSSAPFDAPTVQSVTASTVTEGADLVHTVTLSNASSVATTHSFALAGNTAAAGDFGAPVFSNGVTLAAGVLTVPAGVTSFTVTIPTVNDTVAEASETLDLTVGGVGAVGTIQDNDGAPTIQSVSAATQVEGTSLVHTVTLTNASSSTTSFAYTLGGGTATGGGTDYSDATFSNGVTLAAGVLTVPAGVTSFTVTVPTSLDTIDEGASETYNLTVGGTTAVGTITDDDNAPTVQSVTASTVTEGADLVHTVTLSNASSVATTHSFALAGNTAAAGDFGAPVFSNGVTLAAGVLTVPAGVTSFTVTIPTVNDTVAEASETLDLTVGGVGAVGTIQDNDGAPTIQSVSAATQVEGTSLVHTVTLTNASSSTTSFAYTLGGGTATGGGTDYSDATFSNGVTLAAGVLTVPAGVTSFTVTVPTSLDTIDEGASETYNLTVGGTTAVGTITDDDNAPTVQSVTASTVTEGADLVHTVTLSNASSVATTHSFALAGNTAAAGDFGAPVFSNGVTLAAGVLTVPAGVTSFTVTIPTVNDTVAEASETLDLTVGGVGAVGTIQDNDGAPTIQSVSAATQVEGTSLVHTVTLTNASSSTTSFAYTLGGGTATGGGTDYSDATFSNGVTLAAGVLTVPAGVTSFTVTVPTSLDTIDEGASETYNLTVGGTTAVGTITDDDNAPTVQSVTASTVTEGADLVHTVTLSNASSVATTHSFALAGNTAAAGDFGAPVFSNGVTLAAGVLTVPAGVTSFTVTIPTVNDTVAEASETLDLTVGGVGAVGTIQDNDGAPTIQSVSAATQVEGTSLVHTVTLTNASSSTTSFAYTLGGGTATGGGTDYSDATFSNGVTLAAGVLTVPAGVTSFTVTVPTSLDTIDEGASETYNLTVGGTTAVGTITDDDNAPTVQSVTASTVTEGADLVHTVTLSNASSVATTHSFALAGNTAAAGDFGAPVFSNGVTLAAGVLTVPAGVTSFTVTIPTVNDTVAEASETLDLTVGGVGAVGTIQDNDGAPTIQSVSAATQVEGTSLVHTVTLTNASSSTTSFAYTLGGGTATGGGTDYSDATFSNGVTLAAGVLTVPAGVTSFTVTVPTSLDTIDEGASETYNLTVGGTTAVGTITDDDNAPTVQSVTASTVTEGADLVHTVTLSNASSVATTHSFALAGNTAAAGDFGAPVFSNGVTLAAGVLTVPAGVTSFTVTIPTVNDTVAEASETLDLTVGGVGAVGTIQDNDGAPTIQSVSAATQVEGTSLVHTVTLTNASSSTTSFAYTLGGGTATGGGTDYSDATFSNGVTLAAGVLTVPAGVTSFTVTVPTSLDTIDEGASETYNLTVGGTTAVGTITDDDNAPTVQSVTASTVTEGADLVHTVTLSNASSVATTHSFALAGNTAAAGDFGAPVFSNGVTLAAGVLTVPAGVTSFTVTIPTVNDTVAEASETLDLTVGGVGAVGTIQDNDGAPTIQSVSAATQVEGTSLVHTVTLTNASSSTTSFAYTLGGGTATGGGTDYSDATFSNGVTLAAGVLTVPAGVTSFTVTVPTSLDTIDEGASETYNLTVGGTTAVGTITDDDNAPTVQSVTASTVTEGADLVHTVTLSNASSVATTHSFALAGNTAAAGDFGAPVFSNGVTLAAGVLTVPAGVTSFTVTIPTVNDTVAEASETLDLTVGGVGAVGTIQDNDGAPTIQSVSAATQVEGTSLVHTVTLTNASSSTTSFAYTLGGGTATGGGTDYSDATFSNGVTLAAGVLTVPAGVTSFTVTVPTSLDTIDEGASETYNLTVGGTTAVGTITDDDNAPTVQSVTASTVTEGADLVHTVTLSNASSVATTHSFALAGNTAAAGDFGAPVFSNGVTLAAGVLTVPAGVTSFTVTIPTVNDTVAEASETLDLTVGGVGAVGTIQDNDGAPTIQSVSAATQVEGTSLVHTVTLTNASSSTTSFAYTLGGGTATGGGTDYSDATFSNGVTLAAGVLTVPAGVTSFTVTVPTSLDTIDEGASETYNLTVGGTTAVGTITDDDNAPTVQSVTASTVTEGADLVHTVTLSNASSVATTHSFALAGNTAAAGDFGAPVFSNGVTLAAGVLTVPAGVTSFTVTIPTVNDTVAEASETLDLTVGGVGAVGTIQDNDGAPTIQSVSAATQVEGTSLVHTVTLTNASSSTTSFAYTLGGGTATGGGTDYSDATFSNGVTLAAGVLTVPAGVTSFTVTVPTSLDTIDEGASETYNLTVGGTTAVGTITDDDNAPTVQSVTASTVTEGADLVHTVTLSNASSVATTHSFALAGNTAAAGDFGAPVFSNGVTLAAGVLTVPAGVTSFTVTIPTVNDTVAEASETLDLTVGGVGAVGTIQDNDGAPTIQSVSAATQVEGTSLVHTVTLTNASSSTTSFAYTLGGGTATGGGTDYSDATFSNGVTLAAGVLTVPAGVTSFTVTVPTSLDTIDEGASETYNLTVGGTTAVGTITDDDNAPTVQSVTASTVTEGADLVHTVTLSNASSVATTHSFALAGNTAAAGDFGAPVFSNGVTLAAGVLTVPAGVTSFTVTIPTVNDTVAEASETLDLTVGGVGAVGTIQDNDGAPTIQSVSAATQVEGTSLVHTVTLTNASSSTTSFAYTLGGGTATGGGTDYSDATFSNGVTLAAGVLTVPAGVTSFTVTVPTSLDTIDEGASETYNLTVGGTTAVGTITDDDNAPTITAITSPTAAEGADLVYTVTLSNASSTTTTYAYSLGGGTATATTDYGTTPTFTNGVTLVGGVLTVPANVTSFTVTIPGAQDLLDETNETVPLTIGGATGTGTITDDDATPTLSIGNVTVNEAAGTATFTVTLSAASGQTVSAGWSTSNGTATSGSDYTAGSGTVTFAPGVTTQTITVSITNDTVYEGSETFNVTLATPVNATITTATGVGTITDNDSAPTITAITSPTAAEGADLVYTVTLSNASSTTTTYAYSLGGGTATATTDYGTTPTFTNGVTLVGGVLTVPANVTSFTVTIPGAQDLLDETNETVPLTIGGATGTGTITDDDATPTLSIGNVTVNEAAGTATFTVTLSAASGQTVSAGWSTSNGTATSGSDYTAGSGTVTFAPGVTTQTITVSITNDTVYEGSETFNVTLATPVNATITTATGVGTITDNDSVPTITAITSPTAAEGADLVYTVTLSNASSTTTTYAYSLGGGTATATTDYGTTPTFTNGVTLVGGVLTVPANVTSFTVTIPGAQDLLDETNETVPLTIGGATGTGTITDDDATPTLSIGNVTVNEAAGTATFTVTLSAASGQTVSAGWSTSNGTATSGSDYTAGSGTVTFAPGVTTQTITVSITNDTVYEGSETFNVTLATPVNATITTATGVGTITDNDSAPTITAITSPTAAEGADLVYTVTLSNASSTTTTYAYSLGGGTATATTDYGTTPTFTNGVTLVGGVLTVPANVTSFTVTIPGAQDLLDETNETVPLTIGGATGTGTITDDDATPTLSIGNVTVNEAAGTATFTVTLSAASGQTVSAGWSTSNGTATSGSDYTAGSGTVTFAPGVTTQTITVSITNDTVYEGSETFNVTLATPVNATITTATGVGTITDNDSVPTITAITSPTAAEGADLVYTVTLSNASSTTTTYAYSLGGGTATATTDYGTTPTFTNGVTLVGGVLTVPANVTSFTVTIPGAQDLLDETNETVPLTIGGATGTGTITDDDATPTLSIGNVTVNEAAGTATFTVTLSAASGQTVSAGWSTSNGTATSGSDYTAGSGTVTFAPGVTTQTITVSITNDTVYEGSETFNVTLATPVNATITTATGVGTITDNDSAPTITAITSPTAAEGADLVYTVTLSNASSTTTTYAYSLGGGTATATTDYGTTPTFTNGVTLVGGVLTVPANVTSFTVTIPGAQDLLDETNETVPLTIGGATGTGTITDDDATPTLSIGNVTVNEAAGTATFTVTLSAASGQTVSAGWSTSNGTATSGSDYTAGSGTVTFAPGVTTQTITVSITNDTVYEGSETFNVTLATPVNATITTATGVGTITDNDSAPTITAITSPTAAEGADLVYTVTLSNASSTTTTYAYSLGGGTATATTDYGTTPTFTNGVTLVGGVLTVPANVTSFTVTIPGAQDLLDETNETVPLTIGGATGTGTITDDDATPTLSIGNVTVNEAAGTATFTVTLSAASGQTVSAGWSTSNGTATSGSDYTAGSGTVTFAPGVTTQTITVSITNDTVYEGSETFNVTLATPVNATITTATGVGTITDNDSAPTITAITSPTAAEGADLVYTVTLSNASSTTTTYAYSLGGGTATATTDYGTTPTFTNGVTLVGGVLTVPANVTSFTVTIPGAQDLLDETNETVPLTIGGATGTGTITDDDATPTLSIGNVTVNEAAGTATFTVTLSAASGQTVSAGWSTSNGTATSGSDYTAGSGTVTFAPGVTTQTITVSITNDTVYEGSETFNVTLATPVNATITTATGVGTITDNDSVPTITAITSPTAAEGADLVYTVTLSNASSTTTTYAYSLGGGTATATTDYGTTPTFTNGVTLVGGVLTVPANVTSFTVTIPGAQDLLDETNETVPLTIGGATGTGTITDDDATPTLSIGNVTVNEAAGTATFTVTLSAASGQTVSAGWSTSNGTATSGSDYTAGSGTVTFAPGVTTQTITVSITNDTVYEGSETFNVTLATPVNATITTATGVGTITDNDSVPTITAITSPTAAEGADLVYTVTLSNASSTTTTYAYSLGGGTATATTDYGTTPTFTNGVTLVGGVLTVPANVTSFTVTIPGAQDLLDETNETVPLTIGGATGTGTITDDDATPTLSIGNVTVNEAAGTATFTVTLSAASGQTVSAGWSTSNGTATSGSDYTAGSGTVTFAPGVTTQTITVSITNDTVYEGSETFNVTLATPVNATITTATGVGTITDNDSAPTITAITSPTAAEGADLVYTVTLSNASSTTTTYAYSLGGGTATATTDYGTTPTFTNGVTLVGGVLTVPANVTSFTVTIPGAQDLLDETNETVPLTIGGATGTGTITDDDATPTLSIGNVTVNEAAGTATFTVTLSAASGQTVSAGWSTSNGTATSGSDYTAGSGTVTFAPGVTTQTITVSITNDTVYEGSETFNVTLATPVNATITTATGVGTITDNDSAPTITAITSPTAAEGADLVYTVTLSNASSTTTTYAYSLGGGTATATTDYGTTPTFTNGVTLVGGVLTVPANVTSFTVTIPGAQDLLDETNETVPLTIGGATGTGTITDDDATPTLSIGNVTVNEAAGTATFTVTLSAASGQTVSAGWSTSNGTATSGSDYTAGSGTVTFAPGVTTQTITVSITNDTVYEGSETFNVTLATPVNATITTATGVGTITDNDSVPTITAITSPTAAEGADLVYTVTLSNASSTTTTYAYSLGGGTATATTDYGTTPTFTNGVTLVGGVLTVPANVTSFTVTIPGAQDLLDETNETVPLTIGGATGTGTITDDDATPTLSIGNVTVNEAAGTATFTVTLSAASGQTVSAGWSTSNGTATSGSDYTAGSGTVTFAPGVTTQTITVSITNDTVYEGSETFNVTLATPVNATITTATGVGTITDNDSVPTITAISSPTVTEGANLVYTVTLSNASSTAVTHPFSVSGTAIAGDDYGITPTFTNGVTLSGTDLIVPAGVTNFTITIPTINDVLNEASETLIVTSNVSGVSGTGTILDNDPTPSLTINDVVINESAGTATFTVTLSAASGQTVSVGYNTANGTATAGQDYTAATGTLTFAPGVTTQTVTVNITNDTTDEPNETFYVNLVAPTNAIVADALGVATIVDNDNAPTISSVSAVSATEGGALVHTVMLSNGSAVATTFAYSLGGGTATSGVDYSTTPTFSNGVTLSGGILTVPAGVTTFTVTIPSIQDTIDEPGSGETYNLVVGGVTGVGTIIDDDATPTLTVSNISVFEIDNLYAVFEVSLSHPSSAAVAVALGFGGGSAIGGTSTAANSTTDYGNNTRMEVSTDGGLNWSGIGTTTATFAAGATSILVRTYINANTQTESQTETFNLTATITGGTATGSSTATTSVGTATIIDDTITVSSATVGEGGNLVYNVNLSTHTGIVITTTLDIGGTASAVDYGALAFSNGVTYNAVTGMITIPAATTGFTITAPTVNDTLDEPDETLLITIGGATGTGTITDNDAAPSMSINDVTVNEGAGTATFTVTLSAASSYPITVDYNTASGTAVVGSDFAAASGTLSFAPGQTTQTITVSINNDAVYEGPETFKVNLLNPTNATISDNQGIGTIMDNGTGMGGTDNDTPSFAVSSVSVSDQTAGGYANFVVSLSNASTVATTFSLALANGSATGGGVDYGAAGAGNLQISTNNGATWVNATSATIPANSTYVLVRTPITADALNEGSETFTLTATRTGGATSNTSAFGTGTITDVYNGPNAINDAPAGILIEDTATTTVSGNAILGGTGNVADTDPNGDALTITGAVAGTGPVIGAVTLGGPLTVNGTYGTLQILANGSYTYTLDNSRIQTQNLINGQNASDVFTYKITDGNGGYDTATISVAVQGTLDLTAITPQPVPITADGLAGEYYGYNDMVVNGNRVHADDGTATSLGTSANLESVEDIEKIINGRNIAMGGTAIVGTNAAAEANVADVLFTVRTLNYGTSPIVSGSLGGNQAQSAGNALLAQDNVAGSSTRALSNFLDQDSSTGVVQTGTPTGVGATQTGLGRTTDAIIRMTGYAYLERGNYDFRVTADDGFRLKVGGETLLEFDGNQSPTTRTYKNVEVSDLISGLTSIELIYWEQGGNANLQFEYKLSSSGAWVPFSLDSLAFFSTANAPVLTDTRIQDIVETSINQQYELRTGSVLDGDNNINTLNGAAGRDYIQGFGGNDIMNGFGGADYLDGGAGNDVLNGGDGNDILIGGTGNDTMTGGLGDDIFRIDSAGDIVIENAGEGTDTIEIEATYNPGTYVLGANFENLLIYGTANVNGTGNALDNRMTGNDGNNILNGLGGDDRLLGGKGNDTLTGGTGSDIFEWNLADKGTFGAPAIDTIIDFQYGATKIDSLDLRDLLVGEASTELDTSATPNIGNLLNYLDISYSAATNDTTIRVSSTGGFTGGNYVAGAEDQRIVLDNYNLYSAAGITGTTNETQLLQTLLKNGTLIVD